MQQVKIAKENVRNFFQRYECWIIVSSILSDISRNLTVSACLALAKLIIFKTPNRERTLFFFFIHASSKYSGFKFRFFRFHSFCLKVSLLELDACHPHFICPLLSMTTDVYGVQKPDGDMQDVPQQLVVPHTSDSEIFCYYDEAHNL